MVTHLHVGIILVYLASTTSGQEGRILAPPSSVNATLNSVIIIHCNGTGELLSWRVDTLSVNDRVVQRRGIVSNDTQDMQTGTRNITLTVPATMANNNSVIECIAIGFTTNDRANATLKVQGLLDPPPALEITLTETNILNLTWMAPFTLDITDVDPDIIDYLICHNITSCSTGSFHFVGAGCSNSSSGCFNLSDARASTSGATNYLLPSLCEPVEFYVSARNGAGLGRASNVTFVPGNVHRPTRIGNTTAETTFVRNQPVVEIVFAEDGNCTLVFEAIFQDSSGSLVCFPEMIPELTGGEMNALTFSKELEENENYDVTITGGKGPNSIRENTTLTTFDVQEADVTPGRDSITVTCCFARGSIALGCVILVISEEAGGDNITFYLYRDNTTGMLAPNASRTFNSLLPGTYQIILFDIEEDNTTDTMEPAVKDVAILPSPSPPILPSSTLTTTTTRGSMRLTSTLQPSQPSGQSEDINPAVIVTVTVTATAVAGTVLLTVTVVAAMVIRYVKKKKNAQEWQTRCVSDSGDTEARYVPADQHVSLPLQQSSTKSAFEEQRSGDNVRLLPELINTATNVATGMGRDDDEEQYGSAATETEQEVDDQEAHDETSAKRSSAAVQMYADLGGLTSDTPRPKDQLEAVHYTEIIPQKPEASFPGSPPNTDVCGGEPVFEAISVAAPPLEQGPTLDNLVNQLNPVAHKWQELGEHLGVSETLLDETYTNIDSINECLQEMLGIWLRNHDGPPTWREVAEALHKIGEHRLGEHIYQIHETSAQGIIPGAVDSFSRPPVAPPPPPVPPRGGRANVGISEATSGIIPGAVDSFSRPPVAPPPPPVPPRGGRANVGISEATSGIIPGVVESPPVTPPPPIPPRGRQSD